MKDILVLMYLLPSSVLIRAIGLKRPWRGEVPMDLILYSYSVNGSRSLSISWYVDLVGQEHEMGKLGRRRTQERDVHVCSGGVKRREMG